MRPDCKSSFKRTLVRLFYRLLDGVLLEPPRLRDVPSNLALLEGLWYRGESSRYHECPRSRLNPEVALTAFESLVKKKMDDLINRVKTTSFHTIHNNINRMFGIEAVRFHGGP